MTCARERIEANGQTSRGGECQTSCTTARARKLEIFLLTKLIDRDRIEHGGNQCRHQLLWMVTKTLRGIDSP
jgi:hypothetical protein